MAIVLQSSTLVEDRQRLTICPLASLLWIMDLTVFPNPFDVLDIKTALEAGQPGTFDEDVFKNYLLELFSLPIDTVSLSADELSRYNQIREYLEVDINAACCTIGGDTPSVSNTVAKLIKNVSSATFEHELRFEFDLDVTCDVFEVEVSSINPDVGAPALTPAAPYSVFSAGCDTSTAKHVFSKIYVDAAADPSGFNYGFDIDIKDKNGGVLASITVSALAP